MKQTPASETEAEAPTPSDRIGGCVYEVNKIESSLQLALVAVSSAADGPGVMKAEILYGLETLLKDVIARADGITRELDGISIALSHAEHPAAS